MASVPRIAYGPCMVFARLVLLTTFILLFGSCSTHPQQSGSGKSLSHPEPSNPAPSTSSSTENARIVANSNLPIEFKSPLPNDLAKVTLHRLSNGLSVYISPDPSSPSIHSRIAIRNGSRHDPPHATGIAHYLEHMLFKGTDQIGTTNFEAERPHLERTAGLYNDLQSSHPQQSRRKLLLEIDQETQRSANIAIPNELDRLYRALGIDDVNAFTSSDETVYLATVPAHRFEPWVRIEAERFRDSVFRLFYPELEAVYEEKNRSLDNSEDRVETALNRALFPNHPYGTQHTLGTIEHLKTPNFDEMERFFRKWYVPNNMALILSGNIDAKTALPVLEQYFSTLTPQSLPKDEAPNIEGLTKREFAEVRAEGEQSVTIAWPTVPANHQDADIIEVMDLLVDNSTTGLLNVDILLQNRLPDAGSTPRFLREAGYWILRGTAREGQSLEEVEAILMEIIHSLRSGKFTQQDIEDVVLDYEILLKRALESPSGRVSQISDAFTKGLPWASEVGKIPRLRNITRDQIGKAITTYLGEGRAVVYRRRGKYTPPRVKKNHITPLAIEPGRQSKFYRSVLAMPSTPNHAPPLVEGQDYEIHEDKRGSVIGVKNTKNDLFSIFYRFSYADRAYPMLCHALRIAEHDDIDQMDARTLWRNLYQLGSRVNQRCSINHATIHISGIDRNFEASIKLVRKWLTTLQFSSKNISGVLNNTLSLRRDSIMDGDMIAAAMASYASLDHRSPFLNVAPNTLLVRAKKKQLQREISTILQTPHDTLYFGPRSIAEIRPIAQLAPIRRKRDTPSKKIYRRVKEPTIYYTHRNLAQAKITVYFPHRPVSREERAVVLLLNAYLGTGFSSLIFQELREARGLAYSAGAAFSRGSRTGDESGLRIVAGTQADKSIETLQLMIELIHQPLEAERFTNAKAMLLESYRNHQITPRSIASAVLRWREQGDLTDPRKWEFQAISSTTLEQVQKFVKKLVESPPVIAIVGDRSRINLSGLKKMGTMVEKQSNELFGYGSFPQSRHASRPKPPSRPLPSSKKMGSSVESTN